MSKASPNAGLRLLSDAISPHIRAQASVAKICCDEADEKQTGKRRLFEKGLEECRNLEQLVEMFITKFGHRLPDTEFSLAELNLANSKRRVYDVVNVFEGLGLIAKMEPRKRNAYIWRGAAKMRTYIDTLRRRAELGNQNQELVANIVNESLNASDLSECDNLLSDQDCSLNHSFDSNPTKNLSTLTTRFVSLFFALRPINCALSLDEAAEELAPGKAGSVKRRLYDIINVLLTLDLVEKVQLTFGSGVNCSKKPGYQWRFEKIETTEEVKKESSMEVQKSSTPSKPSRTISTECQTSPSLLKALIRDITLEMNNSRDELDRPSLRKVLFSPIRPKGSSTPLSAVGQIRPVIDRKRKASCPVIPSTALQKRAQNDVTPTTRTRAASVHQLVMPKFAASKNLNFTSPQTKQMSTPRKILPHGSGLFLLPVGQSPLVSPLMSPMSTPQVRLLTAAASDSGLGSSPAMFVSPPSTSNNEN